MATRRGLAPTPIIDKNGKQTTVHRREPRTSAAGSVPPPVLPEGAHALDRGSYADRLEAVAHGNALWRAGVHPRLQAMQALVLLPEHMGVLHHAMSESGFGRDVKDLVARIETALERQSYATLVIAARFSWVYSAMRTNPELGPFDVGGFRGARNAGWRFQTGHLTEVLKVANQLQRFDLMAKYESPEEDEVMRSGSRLLAHLWARAHDSHYLRREDSDQWLRLIDEFPQDAEYITERAKLKHAPDSVAAVLTGEVPRPLGEGFL